MIKIFVPSHNRRNSFGLISCYLNKSYFYAYRHLEIIVSVALLGVETLKYPPFHRICFFNETFSFFKLVSVFFSKWNFPKNGLWLILVVRYCFIYIFDIKKYKIYFFISEIYYNNNFYSYEFIYLFLFKKRTKFVGFITPVVERRLIHLKYLVAVPILPVLHVS